MDSSSHTECLCYHHDNNSTLQQQQQNGEDEILAINNPHLRMCDINIDLLDANRNTNTEVEGAGDSLSDSSCSDIIERIEDRRYSASAADKEQEFLLLRRSAVSENDLGNGISKIKTKVEESIRNGGKICKECFMHSIQSQLSKLGIVKMSERDINSDAAEIGNNETNLLCTGKEENKIESGAPSSSAAAGTSAGGENSGETSSLIKSLHRRTLSEIDWHELTRFAQGEIFDPESSTAREIKRVIEEGKDELSVAFKMMHQVEYQMEYVVEEAEKCVQCVINTGWRVVSHWELPQWLRDNDFLWHMHRPQLPSLKDCFCSMFRIHTETGNIWTHFFGLILVVAAMLVVYLRPAGLLVDYPKGVEEYTVFTAFFFGAIMCLTFSWLYHTCSCHSPKASRLLSKLDYAGIAFMIMGSFTPCIYYGFYCLFYPKVIYLASEIVLGISSIILALWDKFATPGFRVVRAGVFLALGCSGVVPVCHMLIIYGVQRGSQQGAVGWLIVMGLCYIIGAILYALRVPERFFPGRCNILFQSHQIFHVLVVAGALIHLHGCCEMAAYRVRAGRNCSRPLIPFVPSTDSQAHGIYQNYPTV